MAYSVYLDQNVLTELRISKLLHGDFKYAKLAQSLMNPDFIVLYSDHTLTEIDKVRNRDSIDEHLKVLNYLQAIYWDKIFKKSIPDSREMFDIFKKAKTYQSTQNIELKGKLFIKAINGIKTEENIKESFESLIKEVVSTPFNFLSNKVPVLTKSLNFINSRLTNKVLEKADFFDEDIVNEFSNFFKEIKNIVNNCSVIIKLDSF